MKVLAVIPARYGSTRFPGKPLALLGGRPVVQWVYEAVAPVVTDAVVATDDSRIVNAVRGFGGLAMLTSPSHTSGTSRVCEVCASTPSLYDAVLNVQGDEPFVTPQHIEAVLSCLASHPEAHVSTAVTTFDPELPVEMLADPNRVKVVAATDGRALYFSRSVVPCLRNEPMADWPRRHRYLIHTGIYAFRPDALRVISRLGISTLSQAESLEQLCWLEHGLDIHTCCVAHPTIGIDTPADLDAANARLVQNLNTNHQNPKPE